MRHLFVTNDFPPKTGGIESYLTGLCSGFDPDDIVVVAPTRQGHEIVDAHLPYEVVRLPGSYLRASGSNVNQVSQMAKLHRVDAIHFLQTLPLGRLGARVRKATGLPVSIFVHGSEVFVPGKAPFVKSIIRRTLRAADHIICVSEFTAGNVGKLVGSREKIDIVEPSVDVDRFSLAVSGGPVREERHLGSRFVVLFVSRLVKRKGAEILLHAMGHLPKAVAVFVGSGPEEQTLHRLASELELSNRVVFAGRVPDERLPDYYAAADVFCMPCTDRYGGLDTEGFGIVYLEAAASGLPCIAGTCGGSVEAVQDGKTGIVLTDVDPGTVAAAIKQLQSDGALRALMGAAGRERAESQFVPEVQARKLEAICER